MVTQIGLSVVVAGTSAHAGALVYRRHESCWATLRQLIFSDHSYENEIFRSIQAVCHVAASAAWRRCPPAA